MDLSILRYLYESQVEIIEHSAIKEGCSIDTVLSVCRNAIGSSGYTGLDDNQKYHFDKVVLHLIEDVRCPGLVGLDGNHNNCLNTFTDDELYSYYESGTLCNSCEEQINYEKQLVQTQT